MPRVDITRAGSASAGEVGEVALTMVAPFAVTAVTTVRSGSSELLLIAWEVDDNGALARRSSGFAGPGSNISVVDWPEGPGVVTAVRTAEGEVKVIAWKLSRDGQLTRLGEATGGPVSEVALCRPDGFSGVVTAARTARGTLEITAWIISRAGTVTRAGSTAGGAADALAIVGVRARRHATVAAAMRNGSGNLEVVTFAVSNAGEIVRQHEVRTGTVNSVALVHQPGADADLLAVTANGGGDLAVIGWSIADDGALTHTASAQGGHVSAVAAAAAQADSRRYLAAAVRTAEGQLKIVAWRAGSGLAHHGEATGSGVHALSLTGWKQGVISASRTAAGVLAVESWWFYQRGIRLLHRVWPAGAPQVEAANPARRVSPRVSPHGREHSAEPAHPWEPGPAPEGTEALSPLWKDRFVVNVNGRDPMLAVGHDYVVVTQDHQIGFFDRTGNPLPSKNGELTNLSSDSFFNGFLQPFEADGVTPNPDYINATSPEVIDDFYDTRCAYDPIGRRFVILSAARHNWTPLTRYFAYAVSMTEDPRDGFNQYMTTESNTRDWPRMTVHGGRVLVAHNSASPPAEGDTPVLYGFDLSESAAGAAQPANWQLYGSDFAGASRVLLCEHHGDTGGVSLVFDIRKSDLVLRLAAFPVTGNNWFAPKPVLGQVTLGTGAPFPGANAVFRDGAFHMTGSVLVTDRVPSSDPPPRMSVRRIKVPFTEIGPNAILVDTAGVVDKFFGRNAPTDAPTDLVSYDRPALAVNKFGDVIYSYGRTGISTQQPLNPEVRYSIWRAGEPAQRRSQLLQAGEYQPMWFYDNPYDNLPAETVETSVTHSYRVDYSTAVVDPVDDKTFWFINEYADKNIGDWRTVIGVVDPRS